MNAGEVGWERGEKKENKSNLDGEEERCGVWGETGGWILRYLYLFDNKKEIFKQIKKLYRWRKIKRIVQ